LYDSKFLSILVLNTTKDTAMSDNITKDKILLWGELAAPAAPQWMIDEAMACFSHDQYTIACMNSQHGDSSKIRDLHKDGNVYETAYNHCQYLSQLAYKWVLDNVGLKAKDTRIGFTVPGLERAGPHTDRARDYTLIHLIKNGGVDHETVFWKEKNVDELIRPLRHNVNDYNHVERIGGIQIPLNTWILLNSRVLHSVENIGEGRISIQCSIDNISSLEFVQAAWA
jgi:hypothetical protein